MKSMLELDNDIARLKKQQSDFFAPLGSIVSITAYDTIYFEDETYKSALTHEPIKFTVYGKVIANTDNSIGLVCFDVSEEDTNNDGYWVPKGVICQIEILKSAEQPALVGTTKTTKKQGNCNVNTKRKSAIGSKRIRQRSNANAVRKTTHRV